MAPSHPPTIITLARRTLREECGVSAGDHVLVAVSGGGDSLALLHAMAQLREKLELKLTAHGVDHGLRPEAADELELARQLATRCGVDFATTSVLVERGSNVQARARDARFAALRAAAAQAGANFIATAHHADDRAETVLLRIARGAGPRGLAVLPPRAKDLIRPLIRARRAAILAHLARHQIEFASDPSNLDRRYVRVRIRLDVIPVLEALSPRIVEHICSLADDMRDQAPPLALVVDGTELRLNRAQQTALRRALGQSVGRPQVRLPGGRDLEP